MSDYFFPSRASLYSRNSSHLHFFPANGFLLTDLFPKCGYFPILATVFNMATDKRKNQLMKDEGINLTDLFVGA